MEVSIKNPTTISAGAVAKEGIARKIGLTDNSGIAARSDPVLFLHFCVRECFAILKDKFMGNM